MTIDPEDGVLDGARAAIARIAAGATYRGIASEGRRTAAVLLEAAAAYRADGLVMGAYRRGEILNWLVAGTSSRLISSSSLPLLMHR